ncbi:MAG: FecR domain-containing protein, partial [Pseudomonadota bacterium]
MQDNAIDSEAAAWAARLDAQPDAVFPELEEWLANDPKHTGALLRAQAALSLLGAGPEVANDAEDAPASQRIFSRWWIGASGAMAATVAAFALFLSSPGETVLYDTEAGETQKIALDDGSSMSIDARTRLEVDFTPDRRRIVLSEGRALFRASDDPQRPFQVVVGDITITDIGTEFQVFDDAAANEVEVLVTQGEVRIDGPSGTLPVTEGQIVRLAKGPGTSANPVQELASVDVARVTAWRD